MCEILIRVKDSTLKGEAAFDSKASRRGDVIHVAPDGWGWGDREFTHDFWRIIKLPNVSIDVASVLLGEELPTDPLAPNRTLQFRLNRFNLNHASLPAAFAAFLADDTRAQPFIRIAAVTDATILNFVARKAAIPDV